MKDKTKLMAGAGIFTALLASLCCITPVIAVLAGLSGFATTLSFLEPFRPYLIILTVLILMFLWYRVYKNSKMECACNSFWESKKGASVITMIVLILFALPYLSPVILGQKPISNILVANERGGKTYTLQIDGMTCTGCEAAIEAAVSKISGVIEIKANHRTGKGLVRFDSKKTNINQIKKAIEELGYKVVRYEEI
ncbi:MAG: hypothetical protein KatS3mg129_1511 [Leptospiraceae bacterium]|nr:MAG: hypothetical protein KatS3mg129_1511 [Leptospiraceae bacterium]